MGVAQPVESAALIPLFNPMVVPDLYPPAGRGVGVLGEILREHPLLGSITVPKLVEAGAVQIALTDDPETAMTDIRLTLQSRTRDL